MSQILKNYKEIPLFLVTMHHQEERDVLDCQKEYFPYDHRQGTESSQSSLMMSGNQSIATL